jgi:hypothetical protein
MLERSEDDFRRAVVGMEEDRRRALEAQERAVRESDRAGRNAFSARPSRQSHSLLDMRES